MTTLGGRCFQFYFDPHRTNLLNHSIVRIDTGFTGELVLPHRMIESLRLQKSGSVDAILADGSGIELSTFTCFIDWFDTKRRVEVVENDGDRALLGVGLLLGCELRANYRTLSLTLAPG